MRRREFITLLGGAAALAARGARAAARADAAHRRAHGPSRGRSGRTGPRSRHSCRVCSNWAGPSAATCGSTIRWGAGDAERIRRYAAELVALAPDVILATGRRPWRRCSRRPAPCRSCSCRSPIRSAPASSRAWRGRAATPPDSLSFEYGISGKWLELLKEIAPGVTRAAVLRDPGTSPPGPASSRAIQAVAPSLGVELSPIDVRDAGEIERAIAAFARGRTAA